MQNKNNNKTLRFMFMLYSALNAVSVTAHAKDLSPCDGHVCKLPSDDDKELKIVFKPYVFNENSLFFLAFANPNVNVGRGCNASNENYTCVIDKSHKVYNVSLFPSRNAILQTRVRVDNYAENCKAATKTNITGKHVILKSF